MNEFLFRGHYLLAPSSATVDVAPGWMSATTRAWRCVYRDGDAVRAYRAETAAGPDILLIGYLIDPAAPAATDEEIVRSIGSRYAGPSSVVESLRALSGRFVLLVDGPDESYVFHDACGLRPVYYGPTKAGLTISSDPALQAYFGEIDLAYRPGFWDSAYRKDDVEPWIPGGVSLVEGIDQLSPNHYLRCATAEAVRHYPDRRLPAAGSVSDVVAEVASILRGSIEAAARRWPLTLPLTAGVDSRTVLAASRDHIAGISVYTLDMESGATPSLDTQVAAEITSTIGVPHHVLRPDRSPSADYTEAFIRSTVNPHLERRGANIWNTRASFPGSVILNGNALEVARCFYYPSGTHPAITQPGQLLDLVKGWAGIGFVAEQVTSWFASANGVAHSTGVDILDLFYWEHRMGGWGAQNFMESGIAHEVFPPFNNRALLELLLTVPAEQRHAPDYRLFRLLWQEMWPELLGPPVNPGAPLRGIKDLLAKSGLLPVAKALYWRLHGSRR